LLHTSSLICPAKVTSYSARSEFREARLTEVNRIHADTSSTLAGNGSGSVHARIAVVAG
jgi:hypothetical protein